ncbi:hypothetical protein ACLOAV_007722 [Pseudogymnoascus australis]
MPLHLLGKKSWNVYNADNTEKVKRDEAIAQAKEEAEEQRMQEIDAARRIAILRGETPPPLEIADEAHDESGREPRERGPAREKRKRKRAGENDTDFEMRVAKEQKISANEDTQVVLRKPTTEAPLLDESGHIDLFPSERPKSTKDDTKKIQAEKELAKRKKEYADNYTVKFSDAAGFKKGLESPWYSSGKAGLAVDEPLEVPSKDVWGNEDPRRKEREATRIVSNDPLAAMRQGAAKVRQVAKERKQWQEEREREMAEMEKASGRRRRRDDPDDGLEGFSLDKSEERSKSRHRDERKSSHGESRRRSHRDRSRSRSRSRERRRYRHRHRSRDRDRDRDRDRADRRH